MSRLSDMVRGECIKKEGIKGVESKVNKEIEKFKKTRQEFNSAVRGGMTKLFQSYVFPHVVCEDTVKECINTLFARAVQHEIDNDKSFNQCKDHVKEYCYVSIENGTVLSEQDINELEEITDRIEDAHYYHDSKDFSSYRPELLKELLQNMRLWCGQITEFKCWSTDYNIELFADTLMLTGKHISKFGHTADSKNQARTAYRIAGKLKKAYTDDAYSMDKTILYCINKKEQIAKDRGECYFECDFDVHCPTLQKMQEIAAKRSDYLYCRNRFDAWDYLARASGRRKDTPLIDQIYD